MKYLRMAAMLLLCIGVLGALSPAQEREVTKNDLKGIPSHHHYLLSVIGGAAVGAGLGALAPGGGNSILKGLLIGSGGASDYWIHPHGSAPNGWTDWARIGSNAALGTGLGWTICDCNDGLIGGALIGGGATAVWESMRRNRNVNTASLNPNP